jgi:hypothetical protein
VSFLPTSGQKWLSGRLLLVRHCLHMTLGSKLGSISFNSAQFGTSELSRSGVSNNPTLKSSEFIVSQSIESPTRSTALIPHLNQWRTRLRQVSPVLTPHLLREPNFEGGDLTIHVNPSNRLSTELFMNSSFESLTCIKLQIL